MFQGKTIVAISACMGIVYPIISAMSFVQTNHLKMSCPAEYEQSDNAIIFAHDSDCSKYYICEHGQPLAKPCPEGLQFNSELKVCDYPINVNCHYEENEGLEGSGDPEIPIEQESEEGDYESSEKTGNNCPANQKIAFLRHESSCSHYYKCVKGIKYLKKCYNFLHFNLEWRRCSIPSLAKCHL